MKEFLSGGEESFRAAQKTLDFIRGKERTLVGLDGERVFLSDREARLCAPIVRLGKVYSLAVNFYDHVTEQIKDRRKGMQRYNRLACSNTRLSKADKASNNKRSLIVQESIEALRACKRVPTRGEPMES